jgi:uncharacterized membrane protein
VPAGGGTRFGLLWGARVLFALALGISLYLAHTSLSHEAVAGCGAGSSCGTVLSSRWAYWFALPVSVPAAAFYVLLLVASAFTGSGRTPRLQARAWTGLIAGAFAVLGAALWFIGLQAAIIGSWCAYCLSAHLLGGVGAVLLLIAAPFVIRGPAASPPVLFGVNRRAWPALLGIMALVPMVVGQYFSRPPSAVLATVSATTPAAVTPPAPAGSGLKPGPERADGPANAVAATHVSAPEAAGPAPSRKITVHNGKYTLELYDAPLIGRPDAPHVILSLFDYTCTHCRKEHGILKHVQATFSNELAVVLLPMPLDKACNPMLASTAPDHTNACVYARIGMAVWRAKPSVFGEYEEWFFEPERPLPVAEVLAKAIQMTGRPDLEKLMVDPWIDNWLRLGRDIFKTNWDLTGRNFLPMLNIGTVLSSGELKDDNELYDILEKHLGLKRPRSTNTAATAAPAPVKPN